MQQTKSPINRSYQHRCAWRMLLFQATWAFWTRTWLSSYCSDWSPRVAFQFKAYLSSNKQYVRSVFQLIPLTHCRWVGARDHYNMGFGLTAQDSKCLSSRRVIDWWWFGKVLNCRAIPRSEDVIKHCAGTAYQWVGWRATGCAGGGRAPPRDTARSIHANCLDCAQFNFKCVVM